METVSKIQIDKKFGCYKCGKAFFSQAEVAVHLKLIHNACIMPECKKIQDLNMHSLNCPNRRLDCVVCHKTFKDKNLYLTHFNQHIDVAFFICEICREGFQLRKSLQRHILEVHDKNTILPSIPARSNAVYQKCPHCAKYFKLFSEFEEHNSLCNTPSVTCDVCRIIFSSSQLLESHKLIEHQTDQAVKGYSALKFGKRYFCGMCYLGFFAGNVLRQHLDTHKTSGSFECEVCHTNFSGEDELQEHYLLHIEEHYVLHDVIQQHSCGCCKRMFKTQQQLENHFNLGICSRNKKGISTVVSGNNTSKTFIDCDDASSLHTAHITENYESVSKNAINADNDVDVSDIPVYILKSGDELLNCVDGNCVVVIDNKSVFVLQKGDCAAEDRMPELSNIEAYQEDDEIDATMLKNHMLQVLFPPEENCSVSNSNNSQSETVNENMLVDETNSEIKAEHENLGASKADNDALANDFLEDMYEAVLRGKCDSIEPGDINNDNDFEVVFESNECHQIAQIISDGNEPHICNICMQVFGSKVSLCLHMKGKHTGYDCFKCGLSFNSVDDLKQHESIAHQSSFFCDECLTVFLTENQLKKHKCSKQTGNQYLCEICDKSYAYKKDFYVHMLVHEGKTPLQCEICKKEYASLGGYKRHKAVQHEGKIIPKNFVCHICDAAFKAFYTLKKHLAQHMIKTPYNYECPKCRMYFTEKLLSKHFESH